MRLRTSGLLIAGGLSCVTLAGCGGSSGSTPASPTAQVLRTLQICATSVTVPADLARVVPSATAPPTSVIGVGEAVQFPVVAGSVPGLVGAAGSTSATVVCRVRVAPGDPGTSVTLVALAPGYARVAIAASGQVRTDAATKRVLVKVSG